MITPRRDLALLPEFLVRSAYFRAPRLVQWYQSHKLRALQRRAAAPSGTHTTPGVDLTALRDLLSASVPVSADVMVHSSLAGLGHDTPPGLVLDLLEQVVASPRTLLFPTHPLLDTRAAAVPRYSPRRSPSRVGLLSELARRRPGFHRSLHPLSSVAAKGPAAAAYLLDNLDESRPLPHGRQSPYARLAERGGYAVCLGIPFIKSLTLIHVAEECLDQQFAFPYIFREREFQVDLPDGWRSVIVRSRADQFLPHLSMRSIARDLLASGAVRQFHLGRVTVDIADAAAVVSYMRERAMSTGYPYMFLRPGLR